MSASHLLFPSNCFKDGPSLFPPLFIHFHLTYLRYIYVSTQFYIIYYYTNYQLGSQLNM